MAAPLAACGLFDFSPPRFTQTPTLDPNPNPSAPLVALLEIATDEPSSVTLHLKVGVSERDVEFDGMATSHSLPLLGLVAGQEHVVRVSVADARGNRADWPEPLRVTAEPLPEDLPPLEVRVSEPARMEPGVTLFSVSRFGIEEIYSLLLAVDPSGRVVWFYRTEHSIADVRRIRSGHLLYEAGAGRDANFVEIDMAGNVARKWHGASLEGAARNSTAVDVTHPHHEVFEMPSGNLLTLGSELRRMNNYPSSETSPDAPLEAATVIDDVVTEFTREGEVVRRWSLLDLLDPYRLGYDSLSEGRNSLFPDAGPTRDWAHANAVIHDPSDDSYVVSVRHQDALVKIGRDSGELIWILGNLEGWRGRWSDSLLLPEPFDMLWPYHPHAPALTGSGNLLVFDNGNYRVRPFRPKPLSGSSFSRVVEYAIDAEGATVSETWPYGGPGDDIFYSPLVGDADWMPETGNVLVTDGGRVTDEQGRPSDDLSTGLRWARIVELTHTTPAEKVFELIIRDEENPEVGWIVYRAERLPSLYP